MQRKKTPKRDQVVSLEDTILEYDDRKYLNLKNNFKVIQHNIYDFENDKKYSKYIQNIEKIIRTSIEYKLWILKNIDTQVCIITGLTKEDTKEIEFHHHPYTLFRIVDGVLDRLRNKHQKEIEPLIQENDEQFSLNYIPTFYVQWEVIELHLLDLIPYVPMLKSYHKMYHENPYEIEKEKIKNYYMAEPLILYFNGELDKEDLIKIKKEHMLKEMDQEIKQIEEQKEQIINNTNKEDNIYTEIDEMIEEDEDEEIELTMEIEKDNNNIFE